MFFLAYIFIGLTFFVFKVNVTDNFKVLRLVYSIADAALVLKVSNAGPDCQAQTAAKLCEAGLLAWKFGLLFTTNPTLDSDAVT